MFDIRRAGQICLAASTLCFALSILFLSLDFRPGCSCTDWEVCCMKNVDICGEEKCLCEDVLLYREDEGDEDTSYCANQTVIPSLSPAFWLGYAFVVLFVLLLKAGIAFHIVACCQAGQVTRPVYAVTVTPMSKKPGVKDGEKNSLLI